MNIKASILASIEVKGKIMSDETFVHKIEQATVLCIDSLKAGGKIWFCGNGGSAADAQHLAAELSGRFYFDRDPLPAEALHVNSSFVTAVANDYGYDMIYSRMLQGSARKGDVLVAISTSGNSSNMMKAIEMAHSVGVAVIGMTGEKGGKMKDACEVLLNVPSNDTPRIQESHIMLGHIICENIEYSLFKSE
jgi:Phosphoheptose isomerase